MNLHKYLCAKYLSKKYVSCVKFMNLRTYLRAKYLSKKYVFCVKFMNLLKYPWTTISNIAVFYVLFFQVRLSRQRMYRYPTITRCSRRPSEPTSCYCRPHRLYRWDSPHRTPSLTAAWPDNPTTPPPHTLGVKHTDTLYRLEVFGVDRDGTSSGFFFS